MKAPQVAAKQHVATVGFLVAIAAALKSELGLGQTKGRLDAVMPQVGAKMVMTAPSRASTGPGVFVALATATVGTTAGVGERATRVTVRSAPGFMSPKAHDRVLPVMVQPAVGVETAASGDGRASSKVTPSAGFGPIFFTYKESSMAWQQRLHRKCDNQLHSVCKAARGCRVSEAMQGSP